MAGILKVDQYQDFNGNNIMTSDGSGNITPNATGIKMTPGSFLLILEQQIKLYKYYCYKNKMTLKI